jgi:hypothetical protein
MTLLDSQNDTATETGRRAPSAGQDDSVRDLVHRLTEQTAHLLRAEAALARIEATQRAKVIGVGLGTFGAGGILAFFGALCGVTAAILGFSNVMRPWLAAILVGGICFALALLIVAPGWKGIRDRRPAVPEDVVKNVKADVAAVREAAHR